MTLVSTYLQSHCRHVSVEYFRTCKRHQSKELLAPHEDVSCRESSIVSNAGMNQERERRRSEKEREKSLDVQARPLACTLLLFLPSFFVQEISPPPFFFPLLASTVCSQFRHAVETENARLFHAEQIHVPYSRFSVTLRVLSTE